MEKTLKVENIKCEGCINTIQSGIGKISNVEEVTVSENLADVTVRGNFDIEQVKFKLADLGYPVADNNDY